MSEALIQAGLQTLLQGMAAFDNTDVVINDWPTLDEQIMERAPIVIIETANTFSSRQTAKVANTRYEIKVHLFEKFTIWKTSLDNLTTRRDAILTMMNDSDTGARAANGINGVDIEEIRAGSDVVPWYYKYNTPDDTANAVPQLLQQTLIMVALEY